MATAKELRFGLKLSALFGGKVKMTEIVLIDPVIALPRTPATRGSEAKPQSEAGSGLAALRNLSLDRLHIKNGTLILPPSGGSPGKRIEALNLEASLPSIEAPLAFDASAAIDGKEMRASGSIGDLGKFLDGEAVPVALKASVTVALADETTLNGIATYKGGTFALTQFTLRAGERALAGSASYKGSLLTLHPLTVNAGGNSLSGSAVADLSGAVPAINAAFSGQAVNLDALMDKHNGSPASNDGAKHAAWSDALIDFTPLRSVTAKLKLSAGQITYNGIKVAQANLQATVAGGKLAASLPNFKLYEGAGTMNLTVDASGKIPAQRLRLSLVNFNAYPFLKDAAGFESIEGTGAIALDLATSGASQRIMVERLSGSAKLDFSDGAIRGINIAKSLRSLSTGVLTGWQENAAEKTDFATLGASFKIAGGRAETSDLHLAGPLVRVAGTGSLDLPQQALKVRINPELVASLEGQGGKFDLKGLGVPVMISGPWAKPSIYPDIEGILTNPVAAYEHLNRLKGGLAALPGVAGGKAESGIGALIGNGKLAPDSLEGSAIDGIGQLLGAEVPAEAASPPDSAGQEPASEEGTVAPAKKGKKREARAEPSLRPEDAAAQALQDFFGN
jgi:AsmA protein